LDIFETIVKQAPIFVPRRLISCDPPRLPTNFRAEASVEAETQVPGVIFRVATRSNRRWQARLRQRRAVSKYPGTYNARRDNRDHKLRRVMQHNHQDIVSLSRLMLYLCG